MMGVKAVEIICIKAAADIHDGADISTENAISALSAAKLVKDNPGNTFASLMAKRALYDIAAWWGIDASEL